MPSISAPVKEEVLLQGNAAIARGALEAGLSWVSGYPGNPSSEILENLAEVAKELGFYAEWSVNEKVALEGAAAAALSGLRALVTMKQNGVNVCLDTLTNLALSGIRGALVLAVADDPSAISSSNEEDSRFVAALAHLPMLEPSSPQEALDMTRFAFDLSEEIGNIVVLRSVSRLSHGRANVRVGEIATQRNRPCFDRNRPFVTMPVIPLHQAMYAKLDQARRLFETSPFNRYEGPENPDILAVVCGPSYYYVREALEMTGLADQVGLLKIGTTYPLPEALLLKYLSGVSSVLVVEEIDPILEKNIKVLAAGAGPDIGVKRFYGKLSGHIPAVGEVTPGTVVKVLKEITGRGNGAENHYAAKAAEKAGRLAPPREFGFCPGCPHRASYWAIKNALARDDRQGFVSGDIGCYTLGMMPTGFGQVKSVHAMGSGVGLASGLGKLTGLGFEQPVISVVGDSTFFHAAVPALTNAVYHQSRFLLVVLDNSATAMTGFQPHPGTGQSAVGDKLTPIRIEDVCESLGIQVTIRDPYDLEASRALLSEELKRLNGVKVIIFRRTCALVQGREGGFPYQMHVDPAVCRGESCGCNRYCNRVFRCPGLVWNPETGRAQIDDVICVGCGVCTQVCPAGAIVKEKVR